MTILNLDSNPFTTLPKIIGNLNRLTEHSYVRFIQKEIELNYKIHKNYFYNQVFEELIAKSLHPSRMAQFIEEEYDYDYD